jgi:hypothetical protein
VAVRLVIHDEISGELFAMPQPHAGALRRQIDDLWATGICGDSPVDLHSGVTNAYSLVLAKVASDFGHQKAVEQRSRCVLDLWYRRPTTFAQRSPDVERTTRFFQPNRAGVIIVSWMPL